MVWREAMWKGRRADYSRRWFSVEGGRIYYRVGSTKVFVDTLK
jgi:hypothetical protein